MFRFRSAGQRLVYAEAIALRDSLQLPDTARVRIRKRKPSHPTQTYFEVMVGEDKDDDSAGEQKRDRKKQTGSDKQLNEQIKDLRRQ